jgi:Tol biopolymer transport system component
MTKTSTYASCPFDLSPDGKKIAVTRTDPGTSKTDVRLIGWERNVSTRLTFDGAVSGDVIGSPDGLRVAYSSHRKGNEDIYEK